MFLVLVFSIYLLGTTTAKTFLVQTAEEFIGTQDSSDSNLNSDSDKDYSISNTASLCRGLCDGDIVGNNTQGLGLVQLVAIECWL